MAQLRNKRAQAIAEQEAMLRRGGRSSGSSNDGSLGLLGMRAPNEFGQTSIFSKKPEVNPEFNAETGEGNPYQENTKAGKRLNLKEYQSRMAEAEGRRIAKEAHARDIEMENIQSGNRTKEGLAASQDKHDKMDATTKLALIRKGRALNPKATDEEAMVLGAQLENTEGISKEGFRKANEPHLGKTAEATHGATQRDANSKDEDYYKRRNSAEIAASQAKGFVDIGQGGSVDNNTGNIYKPGSSKVINEDIPMTFGPDGKPTSFGGKRERLMTSDPGIVGGGPKAKIDMSKYADPSAVPDLDTNSNGNSANPKGGSTSTVQTTDSSTMNVGDTYEGFNPFTVSNPMAVKPFSPDFIKSDARGGPVNAPVIPSLQAPQIPTIGAPSMESGFSFDNPFQKQQNPNPFGIPSPAPLPPDQQAFDPGVDPIYGNAGMRQKPMPQIPQIPQPQTQLGVPPAPGAKPQSQLTVPDIMGLLQQYLSKPKPTPTYRPGF